MCKIFVRLPTFYELFLIPNWGNNNFRKRHNILKAFTKHTNNWVFRNIVPQKRHAPAHRSNTSPCPEIACKWLGIHVPRLEREGNVWHDGQSGGR